MNNEGEDTSSERRLAENEVVFKQLNQQIHQGYDETNRLAREDSQPEYIVQPHKSDVPLHFYCECADEKCAERVLLNIHDYKAIHEHPNDFVILPGHEVASIEEVVLKKPGYLVVRKHSTPPAIATKLNPTSLDNS